jgi:putative oxygen-independent coproporphyrinogen III oxidase
VTPHAIASERLERRAEVAHLAPDFGVYAHIPYCVSRCPYCDFNTYVGIEDTAPAYVDALLREARAWERRAAGTIFLGGGTPSLLEPVLMQRLLDGIRDAFDVAPDAEVTIEANPETVDVDRLAAYRAAGVNRISFGAQSFAPHVLSTLGRAHSAGRTRDAVAEARAAGFANCNLDLIYGTPGETLEDWRHSLAETIALRPEHISAYGLTIEPATAFGVAVASGAMPAPDEDELADRYELALDVLDAAGYEHYEISNWAKPGLASRHNLLYWMQRDYAGLGAGAHSHERGVRWWNEKLPRTYIDRAPGARGGEERLDPVAVNEEWLQLRSRLVAGIPTGRLSERTVDAGTVVRELGAAGLVQGRDDALVLTRRGLLLQSAVAVRLAEAASGTTAGART